MVSSICRRSEKRSTVTTVAPTITLFERNHVLLRSKKLQINCTKFDIPINEVDGCIWDMKDFQTSCFSRLTSYVNLIPTFAQQPEIQTFSFSVEVILSEISHQRFERIIFQNVSKVRWRLHAVSPRNMSQILGKKVRYWPFSTVTDDRKNSET